jgi:hypothetical protein
MNLTLHLRIQFKQYMPAKPIKHGIKVFCLCCAYTGFLYAFYVYTGKGSDDDDDEEYSDGTKIGIINKLLTMAGLIIGSAGRILYIDNYYTSIAVMMFVWQKFKMLMVGVIKLTDKKSRTADDFPFHLMSKGAQKMVDKGWSRRATRKYTFDRSDIGSFTAQATVWKDKKEIGLLHNHLVQPTGETSVLRYNKSTRTSEEVPAPEILNDYARHMGGVDHDDRDGADYSVSIKTERYYLRIFFWIENSVIHAMYIIVRELSEPGQMKHEEWSHYGNVHNGRFKFQVDLAMALIEAGIRMDWEDVDDDSQRPDWVRQGRFVPCGCNKCFFCKTGKTTGVEHARPIGLPEAPPIPTGCSLQRESLGTKYPSRCRMCYQRHRDEHPDLPADTIKKMCKESSMGCRNCGKDGVAICKYCWPTYQHNIR